MCEFDPDAALNFLKASEHTLDLEAELAVARRMLRSNISVPWRERLLDFTESSDDFVCGA
jgi:hypothetical protein